MHATASTASNLTADFNESQSRERGKTARQNETNSREHGTYYECYFEPDHDFHQASNFDSSGRFKLAVPTGIPEPVKTKFMPRCCKPWHQNYMHLENQFLDVANIANNARDIILDGNDPFFLSEYCEFFPEEARFD